MISFYIIGIIHANCDESSHPFISSRTMRMDFSLKPLVLHSGEVTEFIKVFYGKQLSFKQTEDGMVDRDSVCKVFEIVDELVNHFVIFSLN